MKFLCKFGIHKWTVWSKLYKLPRSDYDIEYQQRHCVHCNLTKERMV